MTFPQSSGPCRADLSSPSPIYRPSWIFHHPDEKVKKPDLAPIANICAQSLAIRSKTVYDLRIHHTQVNALSIFYHNAHQSRQLFPLRYRHRASFGYVHVITR